MSFWPHHVISSRTSSQSCQTAMTFCWAASPWWRICAAVRFCGSVVQLHEPISSCGQSVMGKSPLLFLATTTRCGHVSAVCWKVDLRECYLFFRIGGLPVAPRWVGLQQRFEVTTRGSSGKLGGLHFDGPPETRHYRGGFIACGGFEIPSWDVICAYPSQHACRGHHRSARSRAGF